MLDERVAPDELDADAEWRLTPWGCLKAVLNDFDVDADHLTPKMGEHMVNDFMELMCKQGYVKGKNDE